MKSFTIHTYMGKEKTIVVNYKVKKELLKFGSYPTIKKALEGDIKTPQKIEIREEAIKLGGRFSESEITQESEKCDNSTSDCTPLI
jgi:hypothetical protein